ncbi:PREDICTED: very-long-chain (3R)-3-hydroxyacyl-CoA dehydratase [Papilio polytes]|uniref:very-long-chain (3R)-3-hydroxyacyl-CoA dehydratase n=1 Tax=Papilio polytes TaxID=76194 RepID=UPI0006760FB7|nr:PREDICTED: very-long-chain (3R)-3-hydroxyacyl-CoA dehydratase [Papilio polytes]
MIVNFSEIKSEIKKYFVPKMVVPSPFVYWAQTDKLITLKIDLKNVVKPDVDIVDNKIKFFGKGIGAHGETQYGFNLDLFSSLKSDDDQTTTIKLFDNRVELILKKEKDAWWPRLTAQPQKPAWLKINFDLWKSEDGIDSDDEARDVMKDYPGMYDQLHKEEMGYRKEDFKKVYLIVYNLFQFIGFTYVLAVMGVRYAKLEYDSVADTYEHVGSAMKFLQLMQYLEVMHPMFGYTKGGVLVPFLQISGRAFVLFVMIEAEPRMQTKPVVFYLFLIWGLIEVVRYPFYITQIYKKEIYLLTWLRYTLWIPLYPLGILCESIVILRNIPYFEETQKFSVSMPNEWNFAFHLPSLMRVYLLVLTFPGMFFVMSHMHKLRTVKLKPKVIIKKSK